MTALYGREYDDDGRPAYDPDNPLQFIRDVEGTTDQVERNAAVVRALQRMAAGGMDDPARSSARAYVLRGKLLPAAEFDRVTANAIAGARAYAKAMVVNGSAGANGTTATARPANGEEAHRSQLRMAERLAKGYGKYLRYAHGLGWLVWDGCRWAPDRDGACWRAAIKVVKDAIEEATTTADADKGLLSDIQAAETANGLRGILAIAQYIKPLSITAEMLDVDPYLFNCANGTLDLRTMELRPADPDDLITKVAGCGYNPAAAGPEFGKFMDTVLPVADVRQFLRRIVGYALLGKVTEHALPILTGTGCNGKTTLIELLLKAFGDYGIMADPELLTEHPHGQHPTGQADLLGVRMAVMQETDQGRRLAVSTVKRLTGGDKIRARKMRMDFFEFDPSHTAFMVTNHKPRVPGDDPALWRRIHVIPFDVVVAEPDSSLPDRLALELPAVLAWAVAGYQDYSAHGLAVPEVVQTRTQEYRVSSDAIGRFLSERTIQQQFARVLSRELFAAWSEWCTEVGEERGSESDFADAMNNRGFEKFKSHGVMTYKGIGLITDTTDTASTDAADEGDRRYGD